MTEPLNLERQMERDIVSLCLQDINFFIDIHEHLKPEHFVDESCANVWKITNAFFNEYNSMPEIDRVKHLVRKGYDIDIEDGFLRTDIQDREFLLNETIKLIRMQEFKSLIYDAAGELDSKSPNIEKYEEMFKNVLAIQPITDLGMVYLDLDERFEKLKAQQVVRTPTGIKVVDDALDGGLAPKELVAFAAPPGAGKSYLLCIAGSNMLLEGVNVLHYTLEMSEERVSLRYDMAILDRTIPEILDDVEDTKKQIELRKNLKLKKANLIIKEFPTKQASVNTIRAHIRKLKEQKGFVPDVVIVDYGDIMKATSRYNSRYEEQGAIFQELRGLGQELNVPILTATQTNRGSMSKDMVTMEDLGDSFDKARIMDALFMIMQTPEQKEEGLFKMVEAKVRNGASGRVFGYGIDYAKAQLTFMGEAKDEDE